MASNSVMLPPQLPLSSNVDIESDSCSIDGDADVPISLRLAVVSRYEFHPCLLIFSFIGFIMFTPLLSGSSNIVFTYAPIIFWITYIGLRWIGFMKLRRSSQSRVRQSNKLNDSYRYRYQWSEFAAWIIGMSKDVEVSNNGDDKDCNLLELLSRV